MSSSSNRFSLSDSGSERSRDSMSNRDDNSDREEAGSVGRIPVERVVEIREDPEGVTCRRDSEAQMSQNSQESQICD